MTTPKDILESASPNGYIDDTYYPVPGKPGLEVKMSEGRGCNAGKFYVTMRKPCSYKGVRISGYDTARARYPDGVFQWV